MKDTQITQVASTTPVLQTQKRQQAKRTQAADTIAKARKGQNAISEQSLAENPLASPNVAKPKAADENIWDYSFPGPGLVAIAAEANAIQLSTDMQAMNVYTNLEQAEYVVVNQQLNVAAEQTQSEIQAQATATMWGGVASIGMGLGGAVGGVLGIKNIGKLSTEMEGFTSDKALLNEQLGKTLTINEDGTIGEAGLIVGKDGEPINQDIPVEEQERAALIKHTREISDIDELKQLALSGANGDWGRTVDSYFFGEDYDGDPANLTAANFKDTEFGEDSKFGQLSRDIQGMSEESQQGLVNQRLESYETIRNDDPTNLDGPEIRKKFADMKEQVGRDYKVTEKLLESKDKEIQRGLEKFDNKIELNKQKTTEAQNYANIGQSFGQLANAFQGGSYMAQMNQAQASYNKTKAQQLSQTNESIRQEVAAQWRSLAQAKEASLQALTSVVREINSVEQRA
jgi:hypothetical protein